MKKFLSLCGWAALATLCGLFFFWSVSWDTSAFSQPLASTSVGRLLAAAFVWLVRNWDGIVDGQCGLTRLGSVFWSSEGQK
jgi:hypothetical protein